MDSLIRRMNHFLTDFKKLARGYNRIEFRVDPSAERRKEEILEKDFSLIKKIYLDAKEFNKHMQIMENMIGDVHEKKGLY